MELRDRKRLLYSREEINKDLKKLPGFADGTIPIQGLTANNNNSSIGMYSQLQTNILPNILNIDNILNLTTRSINDPNKLARENVVNIPRNESILFNGNSSSAKDANPNGASAAAGAGPWFAIGAWLGGGALSGINSVLKSGELLNNAGTSNQSFGGIGYTKQNYVDSSKFMSEYNEGTKKAWLTNPAEALVRGLWGSNKQKRLIAEANATAKNINDFAMSGAATQYLQLDNLKKEGNYNNLILYAKNGKLPGFANGFMAMLSNGEVAGHINPVTGEVTDAHTVGHGKDNDDTVKENLGNFKTSFVVTNKNGWSDYVRSTGDFRTAFIGMLLGVRAPGYRCGKLPRFKEGMLGNIIPSSLGAMMSIGQLLDAKNQDIASPNIYASNPYELSALNTLAGLRINEYPIINRLTQQRAESDYAIDNSGGLSGGQRARMRAANLATTQRNIADLLSNVQAQNNLYRSQFANAQMLLGTQQAQRRQQANQFRADMTARAHAARQQGIQMGWQNLLSQIQGFYANEFKRRLFNDTMDLYRQDLKLLRDRFNAEFPNYNNTTKRYFTPMGNSYFEDLLRRSNGIKLR